MANRRKDRPVPEGFTRYTGEYDKGFYTIISYNGVTYTHVWPNAGMFHTGYGRYLDGVNVFAIKKEYQDV
jgi:hypothetical protein